MSDVDVAVMRRTSCRPIPVMHATGKTLRLNWPVLLSIHAHLYRAASPNARESTSKCIAHYKATLIKSLLLVISAAFNRRMSDQTGMTAFFPALPRARLLATQDNLVICSAFHAAPPAVSTRESAS